METAGAYLQFFGLKEEPFAPTADPAYFCAIREHRECLVQVWDNIDARRGISVVLGPYGAGKTTLLRKVLANMAAQPDRYVPAVIGAPIPSWSSFNLLESILAQFGVQPAAATFVSYIEALYEFLLKQHTRVCTLIIDDAQHLNKRGQLELLRLVQNLETQQHKLLNLVLFAQPDWIEVLKAAPNFEQRISNCCTLNPVPFSELRPLLEFRLRQAGGHTAKRPAFTEPALHAIHAYAEGNPRLTTTLCRNSLVLAAQLQTREINHEVVLQTIDKTAVPDADKRARVAAAVAESVRQQAEAAPVTPASDLTGAPRERLAREQRAAELLLRNVRGTGGES